MADVRSVPLGRLLVRAGRGMVGLGRQFKGTGSAKTMLVQVTHADEYSLGFWAWGIGADGFVGDQAFSSRLAFDAFRFGGVALLLPGPVAGGFEPTLGMLMLRQGKADYELAGRCEALAVLARRQGVAAAGLEGVLGEIRSAADRRRGGFDVSHFRPRDVSRTELRRWRESLLRQAKRLSRQVSRPTTGAARCASTSSMPAATTPRS